MILRIKCQFIMEDGTVFETTGDSMLPYNNHVKKYGQPFWLTVFISV